MNECEIQFNFMHMALNQNSEFKVLFIIRQRPDNNTEKIIYSQLSKSVFSFEESAISWLYSATEWMGRVCSWKLGKEGGLSADS